MNFDKKAFFSIKHYLKKTNDFIKKLTNKKLVSTTYKNKNFYRV